MNTNDYSDIPVLLQDFLVYMVSVKNRSKQTVKEYYYDLRNTFRFLKRDKFNLKEENLENINIKDLDLKFIKNLDNRDFNNYFYYLSSELNIKPVSRARKIATIKSLYNYLCNKIKVLDTNPSLDLETPKLEKRLPKYLKLDEAMSLLHSIDGPNRARDYAIITLFLNCGLRLSELVGISLTDIREDNLSVIGKGNKERDIHLNGVCTKAIADYIRVRPVDKIIDKQALFISKRNTRIGRRTVEELVKKYIIQAGLDPNKYSPHKLRHTAATLMHKHGHVDVRALQQILGHESISTTEIYTHIDSDDVKQALDSNPLNRM